MKKDYFVTGCPEDVTLGQMIDWYEEDQKGWPISGDATTWLRGHWRKGEK